MNLDKYMDVVMAIAITLILVIAVIATIGISVALYLEFASALAK